MKSLKIFLISIVAAGLLLGGCKSMNRTQKGAAIGAAGGGAMGAVIGRASGNTSLGAIIGATVGGAAGAIIGHEMDKQAKEIENNVPGAKVERVGEGIIIEFENKILFGFDRSDLSDAAKKNLNELTGVLKKYPDTNIEVQGHTDKKGSRSYNQDLSVRRASSVYQYLVSNGVKSSRMNIKGFGEDAPKYENDSPEADALNRRVEFLITANEKMQEEAKQKAKQQGG
jgi:outer membrane protein OmpA-like peptidoglycan-associated protein